MTQIPRYSSLNDLITLSLDLFPTSEVDCSLTLDIDGTEHQAYTCAVSYRDLLFYTDKGTVTYLVDSIKDTHTAVLHDWTLDDE